MSSDSPIPRTCPHCRTAIDTLDEPDPLQFHGLLDSNRPPTDSETSSLRNAIAEEQARKMRADERIAALTVSLNKVVRDRDALEEDIRKLEGILSPLRRMPTELLSLIFDFATRRRQWYGPDTDLWIISQVCLRWRTIVCTQPVLWAFINLDFRERLVESKTMTEFRLETQLQRSGHLPLDVVFTSSFDRICTARESGLLHKLANHCARWEKIRIDGPLSLSAGLTAVRGNLPLLRKLQVVFHRGDEEFEGSLDIFEFAPNLREASLNLDHQWGVPVNQTLPFSQLLRYAGQNTWDNHLNILRLASSLVECLLDVDDISMPPTTLVTLPHLRRLSMSRSNLLDCLDTPQLEELYCCSASDHLSSLFKRRRPYRLQKLVLLFPASVTDVSGVLRCVPTITDISVSVRRSSIDDMSGVLTLRNEPTDIGLALSSLTLICGERLQLSNFLSVSSDSEDALVDMVTSRWRGGQLRSITVPDDHFSLQMEGRFEPLRQEGSNVKLTLTVDHDDKTLVPPHLRFSRY
ncbi:hypothetical protein DFH06DRAFT_472528 [Mycena polygramma]|nr:hypothetical protein DFH06DRAFT_472528 [Mycena polygramma]